MTIRAISGEIVIESNTTRVNVVASKREVSAPSQSQGDTTLTQKTKLPLPDPRVLWGRALLAIKKANKIMLHSVCVNLGNFELRGNTLCVVVPSKLDYEMLRKPQNCGDLVESLRNLGYNVNIEFVLDESAREMGEGKINRLQKILGADIQVIN